MNFVHRFLPGPAGSRRTLVLLHGTGGNESSLLELAPMLDPEASILGVRGNSREEGMNRFFRRFGEGLFDEADILKQASDLNRFLIEARTDYSFGDETVAVGYSNGANMAAAMLLLFPELFQGAVLLRAMLPLTPTTLPNLAGTRVQLSSGSEDRMIPLDSAVELAGLLTRCGAEVDHRITPTGHSLSREDVDSATTWLGSPALR